jgi:phosphohistidine phosphatase
MKTLYVVRHAKSSWDDPEKADFDRPLNERGKTDAPRMGKRLKEKDVHPNVIIASPAKRARSTAKRIAREIGYAKENIKTDRALYHAGEAIILDVIRQVKPKHDVLMIVGHNPGLTDFVNALMDESSNPIDNIPTCGIVAFTFQTDDWKKIDWGKGKMLFFDYPKSRAD